MGAARPGCSWQAIMEDRGVPAATSHGSGAWGNPVSRVHRKGTTMNNESYDILRRAVIEALGPRPTPERRRQVAADLRALAEQQARMAARVEARGPDGEPAPRCRRPPGMYVRIRHESDPLTGGRRIRLLLGKQAWSDLGSPERILVQPTGPEIWIVATRAASGLRVETGVGLPGCLVPAGTPLDGLAPGRYAATLRAGALVIGAREEEAGR